MHALTRFILLILMAFSSFTTYAGTAKPVTIQDAWVRATAPGQKVGAAYMTLKHSENITLIAADADIAGSVEIHSMTMNNGIMKMRMLEKLPIQADKPTKLTPSGLHLMLFDLKKPLKSGESVTLTLCFKAKNGLVTHQTMVLPIKELVR